MFLPLLILPALAFAYPPQASLNVQALEGGTTVVIPAADAGPRLFTMHNEGKFELIISSLSIFGDDAGVFSLDPSTVTSIGGQQFQHVAVHLRPDVSGSFSARVLIESNDWRRRNSDLVLCTPAPCDAPEPPPLPPLPQRGCSSIGLLAPALALLLARRRQRYFAVQ